MNKTESMASIRNVAVVAAMIMFTSSCANQSFQLTSGSSLSPQKMQNLVLRPKYPAIYKIHRLDGF